MNKYSVGDTASFSKTITESDVCGFAGIVGDFNPVHINEVAAQESIFGSRIAHGMLTGSFISTVLGMYLPGPGSIYLEQSLKFLKPVKIGETITATVVISGIDEDKKIYELSTWVENDRGQKVISGEAKILYP